MNIFASILAFFFEFWHRHLSPLLPASCRHEPTCSVYGAQALRRYGLWKGLWLATKRVLRCNPWGSSGFDPVPLEFKS